LDLEAETDSAYKGYQTVSGFVMAELDDLPREGLHFEWRDLRFEVVDMDGRRIDKILVTALPHDRSDGGESGNGSDGSS
jgi:putative hemolysin